LRHQVGEGQSIARILETLSQQAKRHRLELVAVQPPIEEEEPRRVGVGAEMILRELPLSVHVTGRYRQIGEFLGALSHAPFLSSVRHVRMMKPQADRATIQADLALVVYLADAGARR
jgi:Tfp pilus assembly protein PilO